MRKPALIKGTVIGFDMSLTGAAACALPMHYDKRCSAEVVHRRCWWGCDDPVHTTLVGYSLKQSATQCDRIGRIVHVIDALCDFVEKYHGEYLFVENYAYSASSSSVTKLAELGGALRYQVRKRFSLDVQEITASHARTYLLGKLPRGRGVQKPACRDALARARFVFGSLDEMDAFVIANAGLADLGGSGVTFATGDRSPIR